MSHAIRTTSRFTLTRTADVGIAALDELLVRLTPVRIPAGEVMIRQGDRKSVV